MVCKRLPLNYLLKLASVQNWFHLCLFRGGTPYLLRSWASNWNCMETFQVQPCKLHLKEVSARRGTWLACRRPPVQSPTFQFKGSRLKRKGNIVRTCIPAFLSTNYTFTTTNLHASLNNHGWPQRIVGTVVLGRAWNFSEGVLFHPHRTGDSVEWEGLLKQA